MACGATLKRNHEFDPLISPGRSPKRMCLTKELMSPSSLRKNYSPTHSAAFVEAAQKLVSGQFSSSHVQHSPSQSSLKLSCNSSLQSESQHVLQPSSSATVLSMMSSPPRSPSNCSVSLSLSRCAVTSPVSSLSRLSSSNDEQLFSLSQVDTIVRCIVKEREEQVRNTFNHVLHNKLAEQHESFVRFTSDQLSRRFTSQQNDCSYVS